MTIKIEDSRIYKAIIVLEAETPLSIGSGESGLIVDKIVARDANGLPYLPGTSIAGVLRNELENIGFSDIDHFFGYQAKDKKGESEGQGSRLYFSSGHLMAKNGKDVIEGLFLWDKDDEYYRLFDQLPERDHVRIDHKGVSVDGGKFDEELVHRGTRFAFSIELEGQEQDKEAWQKLLNQIHAPTFRMGSGTRNGFGKLKVVSAMQRIFDLTIEKHLKDYLAEPNSLNLDLSNWDTITSHSEAKLEGYHHYRLQIKPESYFLFGAGFGDDDADMRPKKERFIVWDDQEGAKLSEPHFLIPATSIKGAIAHRVAFHYNQLTGYTLSDAGRVAMQSFPEIDVQSVFDAFIAKENSTSLPEKSDDKRWDAMKAELNQITVEGLLQTEEWEKQIRRLNTEVEQKEEGQLAVGENNDAVRTLFGFKREGQNGKRGSVLFSDVYIKEKEASEQVFSHVKIDRFTGGASDGALYQEKVISVQDISFDIYVEDSAFGNDKVVKQAFEKTLDDLVSGRLALGGNVMKGHGTFHGQVIPQYSQSA